MTAQERAVKDPPDAQSKPIRRKVSTGSKPRTPKVPPTAPVPAALPAAPVRAELPPASPERAAEDLAYRIALRAFDLYVARGHLDGYDVADWLQAEREIALAGEPVTSEEF